PAAPPPSGPGQPPRQPAPRPVRRRRRGRRTLAVLAVLLVLVLAWPVGLLIWANGKINRVEALSGAADTPGRTYLLAGSDSRADGALTDATEGERSDTIMVLHAPESGAASLISIPRDTYVEIPGHGGNKINAAYSLGGPPLLVATVEDLTDLSVDHYVEIGMAGMQDIVDAVGGVELCLDYDVDDWRSKLEWTAGCHEADGATALAFARMRYADREGDIGRADRQRQLVSAIVDRVNDPGTLINPARHKELLEAGTGALLVVEDTGIIDLGRMALAFRSATGADGVVGAPPITDYNYRPGGIGSAVLLDPDRAPDFFARMRSGDITPDDVH
ncbi:MAG TPA: LCP family protein, partial [Actinomycetaceae bacterium]|nr:LCP family protein [Actinomycetaceae bacterium]